MSPAPLQPQAWDWTVAARRLAELEADQVAALDTAVADLRAHVHAAGIARPDEATAQALWVGARLTLGILEPLLAGVAADPQGRAFVNAHINSIEDICYTARDLWQRSST
jgi:hypothetical protein